MQYRCNKCGEIFDEENAESKSEAEHLPGRAIAYQHFIVCPFCQHDELEELYE